MDETPEEREQAELAAREAASIGGAGSEQGVEAPARAVREGGGGEAEGFEEAEQELIEHASHGDEQPAHAVLHHQGGVERRASGEAGEADHARSSEESTDT